MRVQKEYYKTTANAIIKNLEKRNMQGFYCETAEEALALALSLIPEGSSIGKGGSKTVNDIGLLKAIKEGNYNLIAGASSSATREEQHEIASRIFNADFYLMSTNAITYDGQLVNIDGRSNRVSHLCYGPKNVIIVAGMNKVAPDLDTAMARAKNVAAPMNAMRLKKTTPCTATGKCGSCLSDDCICCNTVITRYSRFPGRIKVILVGEELGY